jgi:hypothetical protein
MPSCTATPSTVADQTRENDENGDLSPAPVLGKAAQVPCSAHRVGR